MSASAEPSSPAPALNRAVPGLLALGLSDRQAGVLAHVLTSVESTAAEIATATGLTRATASAALSELIELGLLDRVRGRRPSVVFVPASAESAGTRLADDAHARRQQDEVRAEEGIGLLRAAAERSARRGRSLYELLPARDPQGEAHMQLSRGRLSHDEVLDGTPIALARGGATSCHTRLLLVEPDHASLSGLLARLEGTTHRHRVEVRLADEPRSELLLVDGNRVRITATGPYGRVHAWSREPLHVDAARQLFALWWERAEAVLDIEPTPWPAFDEGDLDVDEWDPSELDEGPPA